MNQCRPEPTESTSMNFIIKLLNIIIKLLNIINKTMYANVKKNVFKIQPLKC